MDKQEPSGVMAVGYWCFAFFLFAFYSRLFDLYLSYLHLPSITQGLAFLIALFSGRLLWSLGTAAGRCLLGLTVWLYCCLPFSQWRGGSFGVVTNEWMKTIAIFLIATALLVTFKQSRRAIFIIGLATGAGACLISLKGQMDLSGTRLSVQGSRFGNANEIAMMMAMGLPFLVGMVSNPRSNLFRRAACFGLSLVVVSTMLRTGSRAGLLALIVLVILIFVRLSMGGKAMMILSSVLAVALFIVVVPHTIKERYLTLLHAAEDTANAVQAQQVGKAEASAAARWEKFILSLQLTAQHPLFGVGPGNFNVVVDTAAHKRGQYSDWTGTHNTYTQLSSEAGLPAVVFFVAILVFCLRDLTRIARRAIKLKLAEGMDIANTAFALRDSFLVFMLCAWFAHVAFQPIMPVLAALAISLVRAAEVKLPLLEAASIASPAAPASVNFLPRQPLSRPAATFPTRSRDFGTVRF